MKTLTTVICLLLILLCKQAYAINLDKVGQSSNEALYATPSCNDLYIQATALEQTTHTYNGTIYNDNSTQAAGIASTVFAPAIFYLGYNAVQDFQKQVQAKDAFQEIEKVRSLMAEKRCFQQG